MTNNFINLNGPLKQHKTTMPINTNLGGDDQYRHYYTRVAQQYTTCLIFQIYPRRNRQRVRYRPIPCFPTGIAN
jgi:hypothetical protein